MELEWKKGLWEINMEQVLLGLGKYELTLAKVDQKVICLPKSTLGQSCKKCIFHVMTNVMDYNGLKEISLKWIENGLKMVFSLYIYA